MGRYNGKSKGSLADYKRYGSPPGPRMYPVIVFLALCFALLLTSLARPYCFISDTALPSFILPAMVRVSRAAFAALVCTNVVSTSAATFTPILPPSYPLAVRNPYLSVWLPGSQTAEISSGQPQFWYGNDLTWSVIARLDGEIWNLFGVNTTTSNTNSATLTNATYTSTHSIFTLDAGTVTFKLDFLSPVSFDNYVRQSLPFSYLSVTATANTGTPSIDIFSAIDELWTGQSEAAECSHSVSGNASIHQLSANGATYSQSSDEMALWGTVVYAAETSSNYSTSFGSGSAASLESDFKSNGSLNNQSSCLASGLHGFAYQLGATSQATTVRFAAGVVREDAVNYLGSAETHYYRSVYPNISSAVEFFFEDYDDAASEASTLDSSIETTATSIAGQNYSDILALSTRQVFGGIDLTIPADTLSTSDVKAFIKEISSDGNVNTVDIIYPLFPFFYVFAPEYIKLLLDPVLQYTATGAWPHPWAIHDIGSDYPNATGHDDGNAEQMPIEESGNIIILIHAYEAATGNTTWASQYSSLLLQWATYLEENGLYPAYQLSTTDGLPAVANMTSLAVKAAVGISAYGDLTGQSNWTTLSSSFAKTITTSGVGVQTSSTTGDTYFDLSYGDSVFYLTFNLFPDKLLNLSLFDDSVFTEQSNFYPTARLSGGVPIDGNVDWAKSDWDSWVAAFVSDGTRELFIDDIHAYLENGKNTEPFSDRWWVAGDDEGLAVFRARPTVGAHWAIWALEKGPNSGGL